jgi:putative membrane protein insertion efficiency factor
MKAVTGISGTLMRLVIRAYQLLIQPVMPAGGCRFHPSCSEYAHQAIGRHGAFSGGWLAIKRICRCHPWGAPGADPVPPRNKAPRGLSNVSGRAG